MGVELTVNTSYVTIGSDLNLKNSARRRDIGVTNDPRLNGFFELMQDFPELERFSRPYLGSGSYSEFFYGSLSLGNLNRPPVNIHLGVAAKHRQDLETGEDKVVSLVVRESRKGFYSENFANDVRALHEYNRQGWDFLRGRCLATGSILGGLAGGLTMERTLSFSSDVVVAGCTTALVSIMGVMVGEYFDEVDYWQATQAVPDLGDYYSNKAALTQLEKIASHRFTIGFLRKIQQSANNQGIQIEDPALVSAWENDPYYRKQREQYNYWLRTKQSGAVRREEIFKEMVSNVSDNYS